jgi:hypothetical protein
MKRLFFILTMSFFFHALIGQPFVFDYDKLPLNSGFKMKGYWIWCGSMIKVDSIYHLFASRWPKTGPFPEGYRQGSEIVRATSKYPLGPFVFQEVIIGERDSSFWDSNMAHNPTVHKIGDKYVLFYIGSDFSTYQENSNALLRRIGFAESQSILGTWVRSDMPVIASESNNPAILVQNSKIKMIFRNTQLRISMAEATNYKGPYIIVNENLWPTAKLEDFYLFKAQSSYHIICEDNVGGVSGHERWGIHLCSNNGITNWMKGDPLIVYNHDIILQNDSVLHLIRRERPQLLIENNQITHLINGVYDGTDSWCQPVKLKQPIKIK